MSRCLLGRYLAVGQNFIPQEDGSTTKSESEGLVRGYTVEGNRITVLLKYYQGAPVIRNIRVVSKPSWQMVFDL
eukprot:s3999_g3.t1